VKVTLFAENERRAFKDDSIRTIDCSTLLTKAVP